MEQGERGEHGGCGYTYITYLDRSLEIDKGKEIILLKSQGHMK